MPAYYVNVCCKNESISIGAAAVAAFVCKFCCVGV